MDKTHYERRSHEQGNYEITPTYTDQEKPVLPDPDKPIVFPGNPGGGSELGPTT